MTGEGAVTVHAEVPRDRNAYVWFLVDNTG